MKSQRIMVAVLAVSALGLTSAAVAETQETEGGNSGQQVAEGTDEVRQRRGERRQTTGEERRSARQEQQQSGDIGTGDDGSADVRRTERRQSRADRTDGEKSRSNYRRDERGQSADRQTRRDSRQARAERNKAGQNARWRDHRSNREFNRRDFGRDRGEKRRAARTERRFADRGRRKGMSFDNRVDRRLSKQRARTRAGLSYGEVTHRGVNRIRRDQHKITRMDRRFGSDGRYTKRDRRKLNNALDDASKRVHRAKNNRRVASKSRTRKHRWQAPGDAFQFARR